jgi:hypothetical protein
MGRIEILRVPPVVKDDEPANPHQIRGDSLRRVTALGEPPPHYLHEPEPPLRITGTDEMVSWNGRQRHGVNLRDAGAILTIKTMRDASSERPGRDLTHGRKA